MEGYKNITTAPKEESKPTGLNRRQFVAAASSAVVGYGMYRSMPRTPEVPALPTVPESLKEGTPHEKFAARVAGYRAFFTMGSEVLFVDESGAPVGTVPIETINGIAPGASFDAAHGVVTEGFARAWLVAARAKVLHDKPQLKADSLEVKTNWNALKHAVNDPDESMTYDNVKSILDVVRYFGDKEVRGGDGESRIEYVKDAIEFTGNLAKAPDVAEALRACVPGLCALESKFNDDVASGVGARGIFQMKPETWEKELGREPFEKGVPVPLTEQVKAAGELFSKMYDRVRYWCFEEEPYAGRNYLEDIKQVFASQEEFEQFFFVPLMINAYNTGEKGVGEVVRSFVESGVFHKMFKKETNAGFDVFQAMTEYGASVDFGDVADYGPEASTYVQRVYAFAGLLT